MLRDVERVGNPWGKPQARARRLGGGLGVRVLEPGEPAPEVLYWVGCAAVVRRARAQGRRVDGAAAAGGRRRLRDPRPARVVHGRPGAADGERVRVPVVRGAERRDAERGGGDEDRRELPALLQHARRTSTPTSAAATRSSTTRELLAELVRDGTARAARRASARSPTTTRATSRATTTCAAEPRELVAAVGTPVEMERSGKRTFCCGAGGAHMWMEERGRPINEERAREAAETGAETLAVACPFCTVMLDDGVRARRARCASSTSRRCSSSRWTNDGRGQLDELGRQPVLHAGLAARGRGRGGGRGARRGGAAAASACASPAPALVHARSSRPTGCCSTSGALRGVARASTPSASASSSLPGTPIRDFYEPLWARRARAREPGRHRHAADRRRRRRPRRTARACGYTSFSGVVRGVRLVTGKRRDPRDRRGRARHAARRAGRGRDARRDDRARARGGRRVPPARAGRAWSLGRRHGAMGRARRARTATSASSGCPPRSRPRSTTSTTPGERSPTSAT